MDINLNISENMLRTLSILQIKGPEAALPAQSKGYTDCQKFCPICSFWGGGNPASLRATQSRRIFVQGIPATRQTREPFGQNFWHLLYHARREFRSSRDAILILPKRAANPSGHIFCAASIDPAPPKGARESHHLLTGN